MTHEFEIRDEVTLDATPEQVWQAITDENGVYKFDGLEPGGLTGSLISDGWPRVLANLKTFLETGETLPDNPPSSRLPSRPMWPPMKCLHG